MEKASAPGGLKSLLVATLGGPVISSLMRTTRGELIAGTEYDESILSAGVPAIYVLWHGRLLPCSYYYRDRGLGTVISRNRDGDYITRLIERWGYHVIRGSSSRGASAAQLAIVRALSEGHSVAITPDGPRGPRQRMKLGPLRAAQKAGVPIVPVSAGATAAWYFGRWDRFLVPRPFAWTPVALGVPLYLNPDLAGDDLEDQALVLEERLNQLTELVDEAASVRRG
jgi:lysophospholipid acyltransferase (LPLAT)-like uncharacterized protein